jgi:hypothetical protein
VGATCEVVSFNGQTIAQVPVSADRLDVDASQWPAGMYFVRVSHSGGTMTRTFSKM